ncbi:tetratricopeptide repeat protein [Hydrogenivirga sp.]
MGILLALFSLVLLTGSTGAQELLKGHLDSGEWEEALELSEELRAEDGLWRIYRAEALIGLGRLDEAEGLLEEHLRDNPSDEEALLTLALVHLERGNLKRALNILKGLKENPRRNFLLSMTYYNLGLKEPADVYFGLSKGGRLEAYYVDSLRRSLPELYTLLSLELGYDTNPTVAPEKGFISEKESATYGAEAVVRFDDGVNKLWVSAEYTAFARAEDFNTLRGSLDYRRLMGKLFLPVRAEHVSLGGDFYRAVASLGLGYYIGELSLSVNLGFQDYTSFGGEEDNRDGTNVFAEGKYHMPSDTFALEFILRMGYENSEGKNWKNVYLYPYADLNRDWGNLNLGVSGGVAYYSFVRKHSVAGKRRRDTFLTLSPYARYRTGEGLYGELGYTFTRNVSNVNGFEYVRHEFSVSLGGVF